MKKLLSMALLAVWSVSIQAQTLGEFKPKDTSYGIGKTKNATRLYISNFSVSYQIYNERQKFKQGGYQLGGGQKGDAHAEASIGLAGLTDADIQQVTDKLYQDFVDQIKAAGLTLVSADEAGRIETYQDYVKLQGGTLNYAQFPGTVTTVPTGYEHYVKKVDESGKTKSGGFLGNAGMLYPKLSKQLDNAIIADVNIYVMFVEDKNTFQGDGAKVKITTNLRIADQEAIMMSDHKSAIRFKGQNSVTAISSAVTFAHGKMGMGATSMYTGILGKPLTIGGVIEDTKVTSFARGKTDMVGVKTVYGKYFNTEDRSNEATKVVEVDGKKYADGVYAAAKKFIDFHTAEFLNGRK
ncbi:hypothetical protein DJ568_05960 [Mucilaginibacter hurinus]|uniref:Uncharacterized protein n=1 Tax=Mucilaginibacter hurinus TaxID=2201324 RepID=A0A367GPQ5_9SPHI|nr:hypothetical protein [Mucilaginibacter hurinus]RCH55437.1 hypothetical protein DJ568_05960 [Mucilaginibacter hurinus]